MPTLLGAHVSYTASGIPELIARGNSAGRPVGSYTFWLDVKKETPDTCLWALSESEYDFNDGYLDGARPRENTAPR